MVKRTLRVDWTTIQRCFCEWDDFSFRKMFKHFSTVALASSSSVENESIGERVEKDDRSESKKEEKMPSKKGMRLESEIWTRMSGCKDLMARERRGGGGGWRHKEQEKMWKKRSVVVCWWWKTVRLMMRVFVFIIVQCEESVHTRRTKQKIQLSLCTPLPSFIPKSST